MRRRRHNGRAVALTAWVEYSCGARPWAPNGGRTKRSCPGGALDAAGLPGRTACTPSRDGGSALTGGPSGHDGGASIAASIRLGPGDATTGSLAAQGQPDDASRGRLAPQLRLYRLQARADPGQRRAKPVVWLAADAIPDGVSTRSRSRSSDPVGCSARMTTATCGASAASSRRSPAVNGSPGAARPRTACRRRARHPAGNGDRAAVANLRLPGRAAQAAAQRRGDRVKDS